MTPQPHPDDQKFTPIRCAIITISDTRTIETDTGGQLANQLMSSAGHKVEFYQVVPDEPELITNLLIQLTQQKSIQAVVLSGGTGIAPRDRTYEALSDLLEKVLPGFGELFRALSYAEIGSRAISSRAIAGTHGQMLVFALPGSRGAVELGLTKLILPELPHLVKQLQS
jgi:molybdopterin adenylyltransferase